ncbi:MAG: SpoIIE family protein phosphatase [Pseudomonadota bacterium]
MSEMSDDMPESAPELAAAPAAPTSETATLQSTSSDGLFDFETCYRTDVGCVRKVNEDSVLPAPGSGLWLVADGMGGHAAGDYASQTIVAQMENVGVPAGALDLRARFMERLSGANAMILAHAADLGKGAIGSTIAALMIQQDHYASIWSGDSRVYLFRSGQLRRVTKDHTEVQAMVDAGRITEDEAYNWPQRNVITRAIGVTEVPECDMVEGALAHGDLFLICSDGLTEYYHDSELEGVLAQANLGGQSGAMADTCDRLVDTARDRGGKDNVSVVLVRVMENPLPEFKAEGVFPEMGGDL